MFKITNRVTQKRIFSSESRRVIQLTFTVSPDVDGTLMKEGLTSPS